MKEQKFGHIINTASVAAYKVFPASAVYSATKFAVRALSEGLRQELKPYNIRTTMVAPGAVATELLDHISERDVQAANQDYVRRVAIPAESYARVVAFAICQPEDVDINEIVFRTHGARPLMSRWRSRATFNGAAIANAEFHATCQPTL